MQDWKSLTQAQLLAQSFAIPGPALVSLETDQGALK